MDRRYKLGACIMSTAIMLPRNTSSTAATPTKKAVRIGSFSSFWRANGNALAKSTGTVLNPADLVGFACQLQLRMTRRDRWVANDYRVVRAAPDRDQIFYEIMRDSADD